MPPGTKDPKSTKNASKSLPDYTQTVKSESERQLLRQFYAMKTKPIDLRDSIDEP